MLSVLIPIYNFDVTELVSVIHRQLSETAIEFEILLQDDASEKDYQEVNHDIANLNHVNYHASEKNVGRTQTRQQLAQSASFDWILFLDADVLPKSQNFIGNYLSYINTNAELIFGGFHYDEEYPKDDQSLRYTFGKKREEKPAKLRQQRPYKTVISANMLVKKELFLMLNDFSDNIYGLDYYFTARLKKEQIKVLHIDNEVIHLGLETNNSFLSKTEKAVNTLYKLHQEKVIIDSDISLLAAYKRLSSFGLKSIGSIFYKLCNGMMKKQLLSKNPSMFVFDMYRLSYLCSLKN